MTNLSTLFRADGYIGGIRWSIITVDTNAVVNRGYLIDALSNNVTLSLPVSATEGDVIGVCDYTESASTNTITVGRNGNNIDGDTSDLVIDIDNSGLTLVYTDVTVGWKRVSAAGQSGTKTNIIEYITISSTGNATDFGDLTVARNKPDACANA